MDRTPKGTLTSCFEEDRIIDFGPEALSRLDETDDSSFYAIDRFVTHLDSLALTTVEKLIGTLVSEGSPSILDLMASWDSHIPQVLRPSRLVGLGLNERELVRNDMLTESVLHDLKRTPTLPFADETFDDVYMIKPFAGGKDSQKRGPTTEGRKKGSGLIFVFSPDSPLTTTHHSQLPLNPGKGLAGPHYLLAFKIRQHKLLPFRLPFREAAPSLIRMSFTEIRTNQGRMTTRVPFGTRRQISSISLLVTAMHPSVQLK